jgi:hypothetical protein
MYSFEAVLGAPSGAVELFKAGCEIEIGPGDEGAICMGFAEIGAMPISILGARYFAGSLLNFVLQPWQQK